MVRVPLDNLSISATELVEHRQTLVVERIKDFSLAISFWVIDDEERALFSLIILNVMPLACTFPRNLNKRAIGL